MKESATLKVLKPRHGPMVVWSWDDGSRTVSPTEHEGMKRLIEEAEGRYNPAELDSQTVVAEVTMGDDETVKEVVWKDV